MGIMERKVDLHYFIACLICLLHPVDELATRIPLHCRLVCFRLWLHG